MEAQTDYLFSTGDLKRWNVFYKAGHRGPQGDLIAVVDADSADHACDFISHTRAISRIDIHAEIVKPGRPKELQGKYVTISLQIRDDLLAKIDASGKSRRAHIEMLLEQ
jgi:hypothetical protein